MDARVYTLDLVGSGNGSAFVPTKFVVEVDRWGSTTTAYKFTDGEYSAYVIGIWYIILTGPREESLNGYLYTTHNDEYTKTIDEKFLPSSIIADYECTERASASYIKNKPFYDEDYSRVLFETAEGATLYTVHSYSIDTDIRGVVSDIIDMNGSSVVHLPFGQYEVTFGEEQHIVEVNTDNSIRVTLNDGSELICARGKVSSLGKYLWVVGFEESFGRDFNESVKIRSLNAVGRKECSAYSLRGEAETWFSNNGSPFFFSPMGVATKVIISNMRNVKSFIIGGVEYANTTATIDIEEYLPDGTMILSKEPTNGVITRVTGERHVRAYVVPEKLGHIYFDIHFLTDENRGIKKLDEKFLPDTVITEDKVAPIVEKTLQTAKESGEFDGYTPMRGTDYWTEEDKAEMQNYMKEYIVGGKW
jgi:hypothetical protein